MTVIPKGYIITDKCCDKTRFYDSRDDFPETGLVSRLYVDRETGIVYVWDGSEYITADTPDRFHFFNTSVSNYNPSLPLAGWTQPTPLEGATATIQFAGGTEVNYTSDGITWNVNFTQPPTSNIFPDSYGQNVRMGTAIIRPTVDGGGNVTWSFVDDADHDPVFFNSISTPNSQVVRLGYPATTKVLSCHVTTDDHTFRYGITAGASVGLSSLDIRFSAVFQTRQISSFNGTSWSSTGQVFTSSVVNSGNTIVVNRASSGFANIESAYADTYAMYAGTNNRVLRAVITGLGYFQNKYELVDPTTGTVATPISGDAVILFNPNYNRTLNTQSVNSGYELEKHIYDNSLLPNYFVTAIFVE